MKILNFSLFLTTITASNCLAQIDTYIEKNGIVAMEMENTGSPLGLWVKKTDVKGYTGSGYLEFTNIKSVLRQRRGMTSGKMFYPPFTNLKKKLAQFVIRYLA